MIKAALIPVCEKPRIIEVDETKMLKQLQSLVGGLIEPFDPPYGETPLLWVNESGIFECPPNRAVYANRRMVDKGYLVGYNFERVVEQGELYAILHGDIVAVSYDRDEEYNEIPRDITDDEFARLCHDFKDPCSGIGAALAVKAGYTADRS